MAPTAGTIYSGPTTRVLVADVSAPDRTGFYFVTTADPESGKQLEVSGEEWDELSHLLELKPE